MNKKSKWFTYMIQCRSGKIYTGITTDVERRFDEHLNSKKGAKYCKADPPKKIIWKHELKNRSLASKAECLIKKQKRKDKLRLSRGAIALEELS